MIKCGQQLLGATGWPQSQVKQKTKSKSTDLTVSRHNQLNKQLGTKKEKTKTAQSDNKLVSSMDDATTSMSVCLFAQTNSGAASVPVSVSVAATRPIDLPASTTLCPSARLPVGAVNVTTEMERCRCQVVESEVEEGQAGNDIMAKTAPHCNFTSQGGAEY
ncbi:unnamed protein product [Ceratitis capitata]|uniref:(Mediterranean fruit fly) hypothetical protein n=1 Tax=Ceratitis capitata TaxID=7213 RepID=A0A811UH88_CERCA|nr:unnamed protein product [Ceratitis capitata]